MEVALQHWTDWTDWSVTPRASLQSDANNPGQFYPGQFFFTLALQVLLVTNMISNCYTLEQKHALLLDNFTWTNSFTLALLVLLL